METEKSKDAKDVPEQPQLSVEEQDDLFMKKWAGVLLIGPFFAAIFSLITIVVGTLVVNTWTGKCGYPLQGWSHLYYFY